MSERRIVLGMLAAAALSAALLTLGFRGRAQAPAVASIDPAIEHYLQDRSTAYAGIDGWATYGMTQERLTGRLQQAGYECEAATPATGNLQQLTCTRAQRWPVARRLEITATLQPGALPRLVSARAESIPAAPAWRPVATLLRQLGWIEPRQLQVRGFELATPDLLARYAADALRGGWAESCSLSQSPLACAQQARERRAAGFAAVDRGAAAGDFDAVVRALHNLRLQPGWPRTLGAAGSERPMVRVAGEDLWVDFTGSDLAGHDLKLSVLLEMEGGRPAKLVASVDGQTREVMLAGHPRRLNGGTLEYLVPRAGTEPYRVASWLAVPRQGEGWLTKRLTEELPQADPAFGPRFIRAMLGALAKPDTQDLDLGLFPALLVVERRADALRESGAHGWLPAEAGLQLVRAAFPSEPLLRAAWLLAVCEPLPDSVGANAECWRQGVALDPALGPLLRDDLAALSGWYAALPATHPLQSRLERWRRLLAS